MAELPLAARQVTHLLEYPYSRTLGPVLGPFLTALRDGRILGIRCRGRVLCPPMEFDPETGESLAPDFVEVGPGGRVETWTWIAEPTRKHPFREPFAFALIRLDGADTALVHAVRVAGPERMATGMRVSTRLADARAGAITDVYFVPEDEARSQEAAVGGEQPALTKTIHRISLTYSEPLLPHRARYAQGLLEGKFIGQRSPATGKVTIPGKGYDPIARVRMSASDDLELAHTGTVVSYTVATPLDYIGQKEKKPFVSATILLDGADQPLAQQKVYDVPAGEFRVGLRLRAVFRPPAERSVADIDNDWMSCGTGNVIARWEPTGEPDVPFERLRGHT